MTTRRLQPPRDNLFAVLDDALPESMPAGSIIVVTSKVVAIHQGRCVAPTEVPDKQALIEREAQGRVVPYTNSSWHDFYLTITHNALLPSAGIDESNGNGYYILLPRQPHDAAREIWHYLRERYGGTRYGVIITDSHSLPLRYGVVGVALGWWGLSPLRNYAGEKDLFGRQIRFSQANVVDALAAAAVYVMGEGASSQPVCIIHDAPDIVYTDSDTQDKLSVPMREDLYYPLLRVFDE